MEIKNELPKKSPLSMQMDLSKFELATADEKRQQDRMRESTTFFKDGIRKLKKDKISIACLVILAIIMIIAFVVPSFYPYDYATTSAGKNSITTNYLAPFQYSPAEQAIIDSGGHVFPHILGTDELGRDYAARVIFGTRISLLVGIIAAAIVVLIGVIYGAVSGYFGGKVDLVMMRIVDIIYSLPDMLVIILLSVSIKDVLTNGPLAGSAVAKLGSGMVSIFVVFGLLYWVGMARLVRGQVLSIKKQEFVLAAQAIGAKPNRIIRKHMLPNCISVIFISAALQIPSAIFTESFLSFLGLGVSIPMPSLGSLAADARSQMIIRPYLLIVPALAIFLIILSLNLLGNGLRDAFDPKLKEE
ncbi:MAG: ABC transporter permease [Christensenella sp.]|jgi:oligopeptide transport system permease protein|nr:ABC transporter permease [Christensenella sp.]